MPVLRQSLCPKRREKKTRKNSRESEGTKTQGGKLQNKNNRQNEYHQLFPSGIQQYGCKFVSMLPSYNGLDSFSFPFYGFLLAIFSLQVRLMQKLFDSTVCRVNLVSLKRSIYSPFILYFSLFTYMKKFTIYIVQVLFL